MTVRPRAIRNLLIARSRLRDVAAAAEARAMNEDLEAREAAAEAHAELGLAIRVAGARLADSPNVAALLRIGDELGADRAAVADAEAARALTASVLARASVDLQLRERQRRTAERALDMVRAQRERGEARDEQKLTDDLGGRRRLA